MDSNPRSPDRERVIPLAKGKQARVTETTRGGSETASTFGAERTIDLRALLHAVVATDLGINAVSSGE